MNFNSKILKISIVIALILMLIPIVAAEDADDAVYAEDQSIDEVGVIETQDDISDEVLTQEDSEVISQDAGDEELAEEDGGEYDDLEGFEPFVSVPDEVDIEEASADLEIVSYVTPGNLKVGDTAIFTFIVYNHGPDVAKNVVAYANVLKGDVLYLSSICEQGVYDSYTGVWAIGDIEPGDYVTLMVFGKVLSDADIVTMAYVTSDTPDPDESNNFYVDIIPVEKSGNAYSAESKKMPATGNPVLMVLLAALTIVGVTVRKRD